MGRPLNKKYFGNRNIGTTGSGDNAMGGEGVGSVTITNEGSYTSALPTVSFSPPDLSGIGGVRATGVVHGHALTAVATAAGGGYHFGDTLNENVVAGNDGIYATWNVTALKITSVGVSSGGGGSNHDNGDRIQFSGSYAGGSWTTPLIVTITSNSTGSATGVSIYQYGVWTGSSAPTTTAGATRAQVFGAVDNNASGLVLDLTSWGVATVAVIEQGDYTAITAGAKATTPSPAGGTGATLTITYGVSGVVITEKGSGYSTPADAAVTFSTGAAAGTAVLTTDSGSYGNAGYDGSNMNSGNQENALVIYADTDDNGSKIGDIIKQVSTRRFKVRTADGTAICSLKSTAVSAEGDMTLNATDASGKTYYVTKINNHRATVVPYGTNGHEFPLLAGQPQIVPWTMNATSGTKVYDVQPYLQTGVNVKVDNE